MEKGGSSRFSTPLRQTGEDSDVFLDKSYKKEKLRRLSCVGVVGEMNKLSHSITTNSTSKKFKLPQKFSDDFGTINHATPPRKLRSAMRKRPDEPEKTRAAAGSSELRLKDCRKKHKGDSDDHKTPLGITKEEEEVAEALFALAQTFNSNLSQTSKPEPVSLVSQENIHMEPQIEAQDTKHVSDSSRKRCWFHVYICHFIKSVQTTTIEELGSMKQEACVNVKSDTTQQMTTNKNSHKEQPQQAFDIDIASLVAGGGGCGVKPKTAKEATSKQHQDLMGLHLTPPLQQAKGLPLSTNILSQHSWGNPFTATGCHHQIHETMAPLSCSEYALNVQQQQQQQQRISANKGKMQLGDDKGGLFFVDPMLNLTL